MQYYAVFRQGCLMNLTTDGTAAADDVAAGHADQIVKVTSLEELANAIRAQRVHRPAGDSGTEQVYSFFQDLRRDLETMGGRLMEQARNIKGEDVNTHARDALARIRKTSAEAIESLRQKVHEATARPAGSESTNAGSGSAQRQAANERSRP